MRTVATSRHALISRRQVLAGGAALAIGTKAYAADDYPNRPIRLVVPFGAGSIADIVARRTSERAKDALGQTIYIENRAGAAGSIGANVVAKSPPDGYTLCLGTVASHSIAAATVNLPYDPVADFTPLALLINTWSLLVVNKDVPARTLPEYFEFARKKSFSQYVSGGVGTTTHLLVELMRVRENVPLQHIPVANVGTAFSDLLAGNVDMMSYPALALQPHIQSGAARALAVASAKRVPIFPDVPTVVEVLKSNEYDLQPWFGLFAPAKTPAPIVKKISTAFTDAIKSLSVDMEKLGAEAVGWGPEQFDPFFRAELPRWREVVRLTGTGQVR